MSEGAVVEILYGPDKGTKATVEKIGADSAGQYLIVVYLDRAGEQLRICGPVENFKAV